MYKRRDYVELYEKDQAKWALLRNVNTVFKHSTLLPVGQRPRVPAPVYVRVRTRPRCTRACSKSRDLVLFCA